MKAFIKVYFLFFSCFLVVSCKEAVEHTAGAIRERDSVAVMTTLGVNTLISDSGITKYRIVTERWEVNQNKKPSRWVFDKGLFLEQFDEKFHVQAYIQCDTAYYYDQLRLWELRSRVRILTKNGLRFSSNQLYWDENKHELYSYTFSRLVTPERTLQGSYFRSDERMTHYLVTNSRGSFESADFGGGPSPSPSPSGTGDSIMIQQRSPAQPSRN
ncbi:MAG: LPS export ABC transporter periplasmic protein LptC [Prevotellaceae bacterium]|jgi:hypothetical protein|nr:LPS export ABC transporter periplasmic protein LptC [Prevotellaceae bacterium]MBF1061634.1 LPS export ABC transporter periplasmic protein LptC [Prevotellaceae bacterium]MBF1078992.1 LPS export ABC transporter periplasmic protein LptC [Prevotellaceae bacterium]MBF1082103.1 LPS export ABC transporter periplasmic protein LptC [Prevotellaceae bacterium]